MNELIPMQHIYSVLGIKQKLQDETIRLIYLREFLGLDQKTIALCEDKSQSYISRALRIANKTYISKNDLLTTLHNLYNIEDWKALHFLPREYISDIQLKAFIQDFMGIQISHEFYQYSYDVMFIKGRATRIAALHSLGIQQRKIAEVFKKSRPAISIAVNKVKPETLEAIDPNRYDKFSSFRIVNQRELPKPKFFLAGGTE